MRRSSCGPSPPEALRTLPGSPPPPLIMWEQICMTNTAEYQGTAAPVHRSPYSKPYMRSWTAGMDSSIHRLFEELGRIPQHLLQPQPAAPVAPDYSFTVDIVDEAWLHFHSGRASWPPRASTSKTSASTIAGKRARALSGSPFITRTPKPGPMSC